jgi:hypothetical protein
MDPKGMDLMKKDPYPGCTEFSGSNPLTLSQHTDLDLNGDGPDFKGGSYQFVITDSTDPNSKTARIVSADNNTGTINLTNGVAGKYIAPAVYYEVDAASAALRRSDRSTSGRQPLADNIVDLQIAYQDKEGTWYCDEDPASDCPLDPFDPIQIQMIRLTLVMRGPHKVLENTSNPTYCHPDVENRVGGDECGYRYRVYTVEFMPRNPSFTGLTF